MWAIFSIHLYYNFKLYIMKKIFTIFAISALAITAQAQDTSSYDFNTQGFTNAQALTDYTGTIAAGKITFQIKRGASAATAPAFYTGGGGALRMYSDRATGNGNSVEINAIGGNKISKIAVTTTSPNGADVYAPASAVITADGVVIPTVVGSDNKSYDITLATPASTVIIKNGYQSAEGSVQIRIRTLDVTYGTLSVADFTKANTALVKNTVVGESISFAKTADIQIVNTAGQVVKSAKVTEGSTLNVSSLAKGTYIVTGTVNGERVSQKVIKN